MKNRNFTIHYRPIADFEKKKQQMKKIFLEKGNIPIEHLKSIDENGNDKMDLFWSAIIRTVEYFHKNYKESEIPRDAIPDVSSFHVFDELESVPAAALYLSRLLTNVSYVGFESSSDSLGVSSEYLGPRLNMDRIQKTCMNAASKLIYTNRNRFFTDEKATKTGIAKNHCLNSEVLSTDEGTYISKFLMANPTVMSKFCTGDSSWQDEMLQCVLKNASKEEKKQLLKKDKFSAVINKINEARDILVETFPVLQEKIYPIYKVVPEKVMIHECLHSASFLSLDIPSQKERDRMFRHRKVVERICNIATPILTFLYGSDYIYETQTEKIATDIMNANYYFSATYPIGTKKFILKKSTVSAYSTNDTNIHMLECLSRNGNIRTQDIEYLTNREHPQYLSECQETCGLEKIVGNHKSKGPYSVARERFNKIHTSLLRKTSNQSKREEILKEVHGEIDSLQADIVTDYTNTKFGEFLKDCQDRKYQNVSEEELLQIRADIEQMGDALMLTTDTTTVSGEKSEVQKTVFGKHSDLTDFTANLPVNQLSMLIETGVIEQTENINSYINLRQSFEQVENQLLKNDFKRYSAVVPKTDFDRTSRFLEVNFMIESIVQEE